MPAIGIEKISIMHDAANVLYKYLSLLHLVDNDVHLLPIQSPL